MHIFSLSIGFRGKPRNFAHGDDDQQTVKAHITRRPYYNQDICYTTEILTNTPMR